MKTKNTQIIKVRTLEECVARANEVTNGIRATLVKEMSNKGIEVLPFSDLSCGVYLCGYNNPYDEIYNIINQVGNAMADSWRILLELESMKNSRINI